MPLPGLNIRVKPTGASRFRGTAAPRPILRPRHPDRGPRHGPAPSGMHFILGVDAGSTTTKAVLLDRNSGRVAAKCYLRTHGNPVQAAFECIAELEGQVPGFRIGSSGGRHRIGPRNRIDLPR